jgi:hypothetical protein
MLFREYGARNAPFMRKFLHNGLYMVCIHSIKIVSGTRLGVVDL